MNQLSGRKLLVATTFAAAVGGSHVGAQAPGASVAVPISVALQRVTAPRVVRSDQSVVMMTADVLVGANARFDVVMRPLSGFDALARRGVAAYVRVGGDEFVPVDGSQSVTSHRYERGAGRVSRVVYRFEAPPDVPLDHIDLHVEYDAVVSSSNVVALRVLTDQRITTQGAATPVILDY